MLVRSLPIYNKVESSTFKLVAARTPSWLLVECQVKTGATSEQILPEVAAPTSLEWSDGGGYFVSSQWSRMLSDPQILLDTLLYSWKLGYFWILSNTLRYSWTLSATVLACPSLSWPVLVCIGVSWSVLVCPGHPGLSWSEYGCFISH